MISRLSNFVGPLGGFFSGLSKPKLLIDLDSLNYDLYRKSFSFDSVESLGVTFSSSSVTSINGGGWTDRGISVERIPLGSPFKLKFKRGETLGDIMCGVSQTPPINNEVTYTRHSFGFYVGYGIGGDTGLSVTEGGNFSINVVTNGSFPASTIYSIVYDGVRVKYYVNDNLFYTSHSVPTNDLFLYILFLQNDKSIIDIEFGATNPTWDDVSGNNRDFNLVNSPKYLNGSFYFNKYSGQYATASDLGNLGSFTIDTWFNLKTLPVSNTYPQIIANSYDGGLNPYINFSIGTLEGLNGAPWSGKITGGFFTNEPNYWSFGEGFTPEVNTWYNTTLTYDKKNLNFYLNGNLLSTVTTSVPTLSSELGLLIGKRFDLSEFIDGKIDIVKIWDGALTSTEILQSYNDISPRYISLTGSIVLNGSSSLEVPASSGFVLGTNYTIEFWSKAATSSTAGQILTVMSQRDSDSSIDIFYQSGNLVIRNGTTVTTEPQPGVWTHVAIVSDASSLSVYYNGISQVVSGNGGNLQDDKYALSIGCRGPLNNFQYFNGSLYGIRINNTIVYTSDFDPYAVSLPPTNISGTVLLINEYQVSTGDFVDSSYNKNIFNNGYTHSTDIPKQVGGSLLFGDGTQRYLTLTASSDWAVGMGDFCVEWFQYQLNDGPPNFPRIFSVGDYPNESIGVSIESGVFLGWLNGGFTFYGGFGLGTYLNQWVHLAYVRQSGILSIYQDGDRKWSEAVYNDVNNTTDPLNIGFGTNNEFNGYITNFRFVKGNYVYTGPTFSVPTSPLPVVTGTKLLLRAMSAEFYDVDSSGLNKIITNVNGVTWSSITPFI